MVQWRLADDKRKNKKEVGPRQTSEIPRQLAIGHTCLGPIIIFCEDPINLQ